MTGEVDVPDADTVGFEADSDATPRKNVERAVAALQNHVDGLTEQVAREFIALNVRGSSPTVTERSSRRPTSVPI